MCRTLATVTILSTSLVLLGCGGSKFSADDWTAEHIDTEEQLVARFGPGDSVEQRVAETIISDENLPESTRCLQWTDPDTPGIVYIAVIDDGEVVKQITWDSGESPVPSKSDE